MGMGAGAPVSMPQILGSTDGTNPVPQQTMDSNVASSPMGKGGVAPTDGSLNPLTPMPNTSGTQGTQFGPGINPNDPAAIAAYKNSNPGMPSLGSKGGTPMPTPQPYTMPYSGVGANPNTNNGILFGPNGQPVYNPADNQTKLGNIFNLPTQPSQVPGVGGIHNLLNNLGHGPNVFHSIAPQPPHPVLRPAPQPIARPMPAQGGLGSLGGMGGMPIKPQIAPKPQPAPYIPAGVGDYGMVGGPNIGKPVNPNTFG